MNRILRKLLNTSAIGDIDDETVIDFNNEVTPSEAGLTQSEVDEIWGSVVKLYRTGVHPCITFCLRRHGKIVLNRSLGYAHGNGPREPKGGPKKLASPDTPMCVFSASKAITALVIHMLAEDGVINLLDPVSLYVPEFGQAGKKNITIHQILSHRGGIPHLPDSSSPETLWDYDQMWRLLCEAKPVSVHGDDLSYHALTGGFILGRVLESVTGMDIREWLDERIRKPMGMRYFTFGATDQTRSEVATNYFTGAKPRFPLSIAVRRGLGADMDVVEQVSNQTEWYDAIIPAGNIVATAEEMSRFFQMMLNGGTWEGKRICKAETINRATHEYGDIKFDKTLMLPMRYSAGFMLGGKPFGVWGGNSGSAFGHIGLANKLCWADEGRDISVSLLTSGLPIIAHHLPALICFVRDLARVCDLQEQDDLRYAGNS